MSWIAALDTSAAKWPRPAFLAYTGFKWLLVLLGAYGLIGLFLQRLDPAYWRNLWNL